MAKRWTAEQVAARNARSRDAWSALTRTTTTTKGVVAAKPARNAASGPQRKASSGKTALPTPTEHQDTAAVVAWWNLWAPTKGLDKRLLMGSQAGAYLAGDAKHRAMQMARLKATGLRVGTPDLFLAVPMISGGLIFGGAFFEMKAKRGRVSPEQRSMIALLRRDYNVVVCYGYDETVTAITSYLEPALRGIAV